MTFALRAQVTSFRVTGLEGGEEPQFAALSHCRSLLRNLTVYEHPFNEQVANHRSTPILSTRRQPNRWRSFVLVWAETLCQRPALISRLRAI